MKSMEVIFFGMLLTGLFEISCTPHSQPAMMYPEVLPDSIPLTFMPGLVTSNSLDFNSAYSPDGKSFYFGRSENGKWVMYVIAYDGKKWCKPVHPSFNDTSYSEADPVFGPDGNFYYISNKPRDAADSISDYDIWMVQPLGNNKWSNPANLSVANSDSNELYISFAGNKNLYFSSSRQGGYGQEDIYVCTYKDGKYLNPVNPGSSINSANSEHDPLITKDEKYLIFSSAGREDSYGQADLYFSERKLNNKWQQASNLGKRFNTPTYEYCSYLTPDGKYFFYSTGFDVKWIKAQYLFADMNSKTTINR